jgi:peptidoglycan/xylan/chitin deacetylase (PgdA/CDA1 family)
MNQYGLKGTFHLNSGFLGNEGYITGEEVSELFAGHEVSAHTVDHPFLEQSPMDQVVREIMDDRRALEALVGYPVRGMSYPYGTSDQRVVASLPALGIEYARTVASHGGFHMPDNFLQWHPSCHHKQMLEHAERFIAYTSKYTRMVLLYVWGHSYEFEYDRNWELVDQFGQLVGGREDIWYATNADIVAYMRALQGLRYSVDNTMVHNPSSISVWIGVEDDCIEIPGGQMMKLYGSK